MLKSLRIQNFRVFEDLVIDRLAPVNLIVGRNNIGKTTLLEALHLYQSHLSGYSFRAILNILNHRKEYFLEEDDEKIYRISRLFYQGDESQGAIHIGETQREKTLSISTTWSWLEIDDDRKSDQNSHGYLYRRHVGSDPPDASHATKTLVTQYGHQQSRILPLDSQTLLEEDSSFKFGLFLPFTGFRGTSINIGRLWDRLVLRGEDSLVLEILNLITTGTQQILLIQDTGLERSAMVRLADKGATPLASLGDGMNRVFELAVGLATVESEGILLVDEVDAGLHYSVLVGIWQVILRVAEERGIQVFATTHSWDCIQAFQEATAEYPGMGNLIRLVQGTEGIRAVTFSDEKLAIITRQDIEVR